VTAASRKLEYDITFFNLSSDNGMDMLECWQVV
jgi:hypothetical protein